MASSSRKRTLRTAHCESDTKSQDQEYLDWKIEGVDSINIIMAEIDADCDLVSLIHTQMDNQVETDSNSWKARVLHLRSKSKYQLNRETLESSKIRNWIDIEYEYLLGVLEITHKCSAKSLRRKPHTYKEFCKLVDQENVELPESEADLDRLWIPITTVQRSYKQDLLLQVSDNRVTLKDLDNPLTFICKKYNLNLAGIQKEYVLIGGPNTFSPTHYEDKRLGSINKMLEGLAIWFIVHFEDNEKFFDKLKEHLGIDCDAIIASKNYVILPGTMKAWGVKYYTILQQPGDIVATFPGAVHTVFNLRLTSKSALNFLPTRWIEPTVDHEDCHCPVENTEYILMARKLVHGQSLSKVLKNSVILKSIEEWKTQRSRNGSSFMGIPDPFANRLPITAKKLKMMSARSFGKDQDGFNKANDSEKQYFCKVCFEDGVKTEAQATMKKTTFNRHVAEVHVLNNSTKICKTCSQRFGDKTGFDRHACLTSFVK